MIIPGVAPNASANTFDLVPYFEFWGFKRYESCDLAELEDAEDSYTMQCKGNPLDVSPEPPWDFIVVVRTVPSGAGGGHDFVVDFMARAAEEGKGIFLDEVRIPYWQPPEVLEKIKRILQYLVNCLEMPYT